MAFAFVAASTSSNSNPQATPSTVTIPAHSTGDLLVIAITTTSNSSPATVINTPSGWRLHGNVDAGADSAVRHTVFSKAGDGVEASVDITLSGDAVHAFAAVCAAYSHSDVAVEDVKGANSQDGGVDVTSPSVTTTEANTLIIYGFSWDGTACTDADHDSDAGFNGTSRGFVECTGGGGDNGAACALSDELQAGAGASNTCVWSSNADDDAGIGMTTAFREEVLGIATIVHHRKMMGMQ